MIPPRVLVVAVGNVYGAGKSSEVRYPALFVKSPRSVGLLRITPMPDVAFQSL